MASPASDKNEGSGSESSGGIKAMLPLILNIVLLPIVAFLMTQFVILPKLAQSAGAAAKPGETVAVEGGAANGEETHGSSQPAHDAPHKEASKGGGHDDHGKEGGSASSGGTTHILPAVTVNVAGTMGSRLMMAKIGVRGTNPGLKKMVDDRQEDLRDAASSLLQTKTLMDIERQGSRNTIKAELKAAFLKVLGPGTFTDVVLPDLAVQ